MGLRLLQNRRADVAGLHFGALRALDVHRGGLQHAAEGDGLRRFPLLAALDGFNRFAQERVEIAPQFRQVDAAGLENPFAFDVVRERVQQMFEGHVRVPPRDGFAIRNRQDDFDGAGKHGAVRPPRASHAAETPLCGPVS